MHHVSLLLQVVFLNIISVGIRFSKQPTGAGGLCDMCWWRWHASIYIINVSGAFALIVNNW